MFGNAEDRAERMKVVTKKEVVSIIASYLAKKGVVFKDKTSYSAAKDKFWDLYKTIHELDMAIAASAGTAVSLSGVGKTYFKEAGRTEESKCYRYKSSPSSKYFEFFKENPDLILHGEPKTLEEIQANVNTIMSAFESADATLDEGAEVVEGTEASEETPAAEEPSAEAVEAPAEATEAKDTGSDGSTVIIDEI